MLKWIKEGMKIMKVTQLSKLAVIGSAVVCVFILSGSGAAHAARDPWTSPFSQNSIWNMPIGSNASYQSFGHFPVGSYVHADPEYHVKTYSTDPIRNIYGVPNWTSRCSDTSNLQGTINIPDDFIVADATTNPYSTPNNVAAFLKPDGHTLIQLEPLTRCTAGGNVFGYRWSTDLDIQGEGIGGTHWGSGLSAIGGSIRHGELTGTAPIKHALKLNVWGNYLYYNNSDTTKGYRWPADRSDAGAPSNYHGTNPKIEMGALMAISPSATESSLGLQTVAGKKLFHALQDYGAYIADDTGWDAYAFSLSVEAMNEFEEVNGYSFNQGSSATGNSKVYYDDFNKLITNLYVIDNNSSTNVGGGGTPRAVLADAAFSAMDNTAPSVPTNFQLTSKTTNSISLSWTASTDNVRVMEYDIFNGSQLLGSTYGKTSLTLNNLTINTTYLLKIRARDTGLNASAFTTPISMTTYDGYSENFDDGVAQNWSLGTGTLVEYQKLKMTNWGGTTSGIYSNRVFSAPNTGNNYVYRVKLQTDASDNNGKTRVYFNYLDTSNTYYVQLGGGTSNSVELKKVVGGIETTLASYGAYEIKNNSWPKLEIKYEKGGYITVKGIRAGTTTTLFNLVQDTSLTSGKIGVGVSGTQSFAEDVEVVINENAASPAVTPYAENFDDGLAQNWTLSNASVTFSRLQLTNWSGLASGIYDNATYSGAYTYKAALQTDAGDNNGKTRIYFNYTNTNNTYFVQFGGGTVNTVELKKVFGGVESTLGTYSGAYTIKNWDWPSIEITYNNGSMTIKGTRGTTVTTLFQNVTDSTLTSGKIGIGSLNTQSFAENISIN
ncbi:fibronectin type III domain-containing protein [Paenibacillus psychroresistens]|uniref:Fibronectin type III domain-containing protein n=1 Tax=Paenibacillus psychroresistens TaxID=1778678 RepID=A0A6B8RIF7_9BACL|nr:fibronectin type III domain-containing protein [Paenibacillus psychroresistens]QGQ95166.1 fibronectin type III domain-containing protein [Paenibacillus psychroresistens]